MTSKSKCGKCIIAGLCVLALTFSTDVVIVRRSSKETSGLQENSGCIYIVIILVM